MTQAKRVAPKLKKLLESQLRLKKILICKSTKCEMPGICQILHNLPPTSPPNIYVFTKKKRKKKGVLTSIGSLYRYMYKDPSQSLLYTLSLCLCSFYHSSNSSINIYKRKTPQHLKFCILQPSS